MDRLKRRLTTVFAADIVGYSRLMEQDEEETLYRVRDLGKAILAPAFLRFRGHIFKTGGDSWLVEFESVVEAVRAAVAIQRENFRRESSQPDGRKIILRIGINVGDVIAAKDDLFGNGINITARLEQICRPGDVVISEVVHNLIQNKIDIKFFGRKDVLLKNIATPVKIFEIAPSDVDHDDISAAYQFDPKKVDILNEVANWEVDAIDENMSRYFYEFNGFKDIENGNTTFVLGRKGTGKTAIIKYIESKRTLGCKSKRITLKDFPLEQFTAFFSNTFLKTNSYVLGWKFVIYSAAIDLISTSNRFKDNDGQPQRLRGDVIRESRIEETLQRWRSASARSKSDNLYSQIASMVKENIMDVGLSDHVVNMENYLVKNMDEEKLYIMFDGLDSEFAAITQGMDDWNSYKILISGLFRACLDVRNVFRNEQLSLIPIAFTRNDIFDLVLDSDKGKWISRVYQLNWRIDEIRQLLAFRISKSISEHAEVLPFDRAWPLLFHPSDTVAIGDGRWATEKSVLEYMKLRSFSSPRDFITYLQLAAKITKQHNSSYNKINPKTIIRSEHDYSMRVRQEIIDEMFPLFQEVGTFLSLLDRLPHHRFFMFYQVDEIVADARAQGELSDDLSTAQILYLLFKYSAIGNTRKFKRKTETKPTYYRTFAYIKPAAKLDLNGYMTLHSALFAAVFPSRTEMSGNTADENVVDYEEPVDSIARFEIPLDEKL